MNLLVLPKSAQSTKDARTAFKHYYVVQGHTQYNGFFYIGANGSNIARLMNLYQNGSGWQNPGYAKEELLRLIMKESGVLPEYILCEGGGDVARISAIRDFLQTSAALRGIPFILDVSGLASVDVAKLKREVRPDEIIRFDEVSDADLVNRIRFLRRVKARVATLPVPPIEEYQPVNMNLGLMTKRTFDIFVSVVALLILSPLLLLIALAVMVESRGPVFYIAKRAGRGYRIFNFYKFRTMVQDADKKRVEMAHLNQYAAESAGPVFFKVSNDPRITKVGSFLRNTSLDELPQLINVLLGDMSLVGNRPLPLYEAESLTTDEYAARFMAPAGITGLWQIKKRGSKDMSVEERISIDIDYAQNFSFSKDLWIIAKTPSALLQKENV